MGEYLLATRSLIRAIGITKTENIYRPYIDEGEIIGLILRHHLDNRTRVKLINIDSGLENYLKTLASYFNISYTNTELSNVSLLKTTVNSYTKLTKREIEIVKNLGDGLSNKELSALLSVTEGTIKWHLQNIFDKLGIHNRNRSAAVAKARKLTYI